MSARGIPKLGVMARRPPRSSEEAHRATLAKTNRLRDVRAKEDLVVEAALAWHEAGDNGGLGVTWPFAASRELHAACAELRRVRRRRRVGP